MKGRNTTFLTTDPAIRGSHDEVSTKVTGEKMIKNLPRWQGEKAE